MPLYETTPQEFAEAVRKLNLRLPTPSPADSKQWMEMPLAQREVAFFSARVESAHFLARIEELVLNFLTGARAETDEGESYLKTGDRATFVKQSRELLRHYGVTTVRTPEEEGTIADIMSRSRLNLIFRMQTQMAQGYGTWAQGNDPDILDFYPCYELYRTGSRKVPRDWYLRWKLAGGDFYRGQRMIARKDDEIWFKISRFGVPWPPFDFNSGMGIIDVDRKEAVALGVVGDEDIIHPSNVKYADKIKASSEGVPGNIIKVLKDSLGEDLSGRIQDD